MSNEELALLIYSGNKDYTAKLWKQTEKYFLLRVNRYFIKYGELFTAAGYTTDDLMQECFFVLLDSVSAYGRNGSEQGYKFLTYTNYHLKKRMLHILGKRTAAVKNEPLNNSLSLDEEIDRDDSDGTARIDLVADVAAEQQFHNVENIAAMKEVKEQIEKLLYSRKNLIEVIICIYFESLNQIETAKKLGISKTAVQERLKRARRILRNNRELEEIAQLFGYYRRTSAAKQIRFGSSVEQLVELRDRLLNSGNKN